MQNGQSLRKIRKTDAFNHVETHDSAGVKTWLLTDGVRCYPPWSRELGVMSHATGEFEKKAARNGARLSVRTGTIDPTWRNIKAFIPNVLAVPRFGCTCGHTNGVTCRKESGDRQDAGQAQEKRSKKYELRAHELRVPACGRRCLLKKTTQKRVSKQTRSERCKIVFFP